MPHTSPLVSLCLIVRNEEDNLGHCLARVAGLCHEIVVLDTGSTDRTREVAATYGAKVHSFVWNDNFSAARNEAIRHATGDYIFWLDADDHVDEVNRRRLANLFSRLPHEPTAFMMSCVCEGHVPGQNMLVMDHCRLFPRHPKVRWEYRIHEQIVPSIQLAGIPVHTAAIEITHVGYRDPAIARRKHNRNRRLLRQEYAINPNDAWTLYNLGTSHKLDQELEEALTYYLKAIQQAQVHQCQWREIYIEAGSLLESLNRPEEAIATLRMGLQRYPDDAEMVNLTATSLIKLRDVASAEPLLRRNLNALTVEPRRDGARDRICRRDCRRMLGWIYLETARHSQAETLFQEMLSECPDYRTGWLSLAYAYLMSGRLGEVEFVARQMQKLPDGAAFADVLRAERAHAQQDFVAARELLHRAVTASPNLEWARMALTKHLFETRSSVAECKTAYDALVRVDPANRGAIEMYGNQLAERRREQTLDSSYFSFVSGPLTFT